MKNFKHRRGNALLFVLGLIFAASILAVFVVEYSINELKPRASSNFERTLRADAYGALGAAVAVLQEYVEIDGGLYSDGQGWGEPFADGRVKPPWGGELVCKITDESGKLSLRNIDSNGLKTIMELLGASSMDAQKISACIIDWTDADEAAQIDGAEYDDYDSGEAFPPNRPMQSFSELRFIKNARDFFFDKNGVPNERYQKFAEIFSLENFGATNYNSASPIVLEMIMEMDGRTYNESLYQAIRGQMGSVTDGITWVKNASEVSSRGGGEVSTRHADFKCQLLKVEITVKRGIGEYYLCAFLDLSSSTTSTESSAVRGRDVNEGGRENSSSDNLKLKIIKLLERGE